MAADTMLNSRHARLRFVRWLWWPAILAALAIAAPAWAGDSYYRLTISNETSSFVWIQLSGSGCTDWKQGDPSLKLRMSPQTSTRYEFVRASRCSGENGQVPIVVWQSPDLTIPTAESGHIVFDYTANHQATWTTSQPGDRWFSVTFRPHAQGDLDDLFVDIVSMRQVDIPTALRFGCRHRANLKDSVRDLLTLSDVGSVTTGKASDYEASQNLVSRFKVTRPIWGFRALTFAPTAELDALKAGFLLSKMAYNLRGKTDSQVQDIWARWGPPSGGAYDRATFGLRALAVSSSDIPRSQYVSVALDLPTATLFGDPVYAFKLIPDSEIFGLPDCRHQDGEAQVQPFGGTPIHSLMRKSSSQSQWEEWTGTQWVPSTVVPAN